MPLSRRSFPSAAAVPSQLKAVVHFPALFAQTLAPIAAKAHATSFPMPDAPAVTNTRCAKLIARAVRGHRNEYVIATKFGNLRGADGSPTSDGRPEYVKACCERSLKRL